MDHKVGDILISEGSSIDGKKRQRSSDDDSLDESSMSNSKYEETKNMDMSYYKENDAMLNKNPSNLLKNLEKLSGDELDDALFNDKEQHINDGPKNDSPTFNTFHK